MASIPRDRRYVPRRSAQPVSGRDEGRMEVDLILDGLERLIYDVYREAATEMRDKANEYLAEFRAEDLRRREQLKAQGINPKNDADYTQWRISHIAQGRHWIEMSDTLATDMVHHNQITVSALRGHMPEVYAIGYNYGIFDAERQTTRITPFTLYDRRTVERLLRDNPKVVPAPRPEVDIPKDKRWNMQLLTSQIAQGIMQGETIDQIADRLSDRVAIANRNSAIRAARTAVTSAENGGRLQSYRDLESIGFKMTKTWISTLDNRTRESHRLLDGETVDTEQAFSNDLMYPGDPDGDPAEVCNCRCTLISQVVAIDIMKGTRRDGKIDGMTYEEWKQGKREQAERQSRVNPDNPSYGYSDDRAADIPIEGERGDGQYTEEIIPPQDLTLGDDDAIMGYKEAANEEEIKWLPKGEELTAQQRRELTDYAEQAGIVLTGLRRTDVDIELIKETIDEAARMLSLYPELRTIGGRPFTIKVVNGLDSNTFAMTTRRKNANVIQLNANAFRDRSKLAEEYQKLVESGWFPKGTTYRSIVIHEIGHMYDRMHNVDSIGITARILGIEEITESEMERICEFLVENLSEYSTGGHEIKDEIVSEVFSAVYGGGEENSFANIFVEEMQ